MRPIKLTISAFGPYASKQVIDFEELKGRNIFVISGKTGAGKTTIFDAISYALYGEASGESRETESLRSHFADENTETYVELEFELKGKRVVAIVSGGNIDVTSLSRVIDRGLLNSGRSSSLLIELIDKPGQLKDISRIIADCGGNVTGVHYEKDNTESVNGCFLRIEMETRDFDHVNLITHSLRDEGFKIV